MKLLPVLTILMLILGLNFSFGPADNSVTAQSSKKAACDGAPNSHWENGECVNDAGGPSVGGIFKAITNLLLFVIGAVSVIMIVIGGFKYVISGGDSQKIESAKNTILYAIIGVAVAILAYAAVSFVVDSFS